MYRKVVIDDTKSLQNSDYNQLRAFKVNTAMGNPLWGYVDFLPLCARTQELGFAIFCTFLYTFV